MAQSWETASQYNSRNSSEYINMFDGNDSKTITYITNRWQNESGVKGYDVEKIQFDRNYDMLAANGLFARKDMDIVNTFNRYGYINLYEDTQIIKEYLFFTKPDLSLYLSNSITDEFFGPNPYTSLQHHGMMNYNSVRLNPLLKDNNFFIDMDRRYKNILSLLQASIIPSTGSNPFNYLLSNCASSRLDIPTISAESQENTPNIYGITIQRRGHSLKSDNGFDFSISFKDTASLPIYHLAKAYDEYMREQALGNVFPFTDYITNFIDPTQFSIYKFLIGNDGETIVHFAKVTGVHIMDVPRQEISDPKISDGYEFSLSFHGNFVEDSNPEILTEFNKVSVGSGNVSYDSNAKFVPVTNNIGVDNRWVKTPIVVKYVDKRSDRKNMAYDYRLKWLS